MNCPVCGSDIVSGVKYCPVCGTDVEANLQRARETARAASQAQVPPANVQQPQQAYQASQQTYQTQQYPAQGYQQRAQQVPSQAVPMNPSMPPQSQQRSFDTSKMNGSPKWPIVLICVLVVAIIAVLLFIFHPWTLIGGSADGSDSTTPSATTATVSQDASDATGAQEQAQVSDGSAATGAGAESGALSDAEAYEQLSNYYGQLDGFHNEISSVATEYSNNVGVNDLSGLRATATDLQSRIASASAAVSALNISTDSAYAGTRTAIENLYNDLSMRIGVLVEACDAVIAGQDASAILSRDNGSADEHGHTNIYLIDYEQNYAAAAPVAPAA